MTTPEVDQRSAERRALDEKIAAEPLLALPELAADAAPVAMEVHLARLRPRLLAVAGIVENGLVRPLDPAVKLREHSRVIIVTIQRP